MNNSNQPGTTLRCKNMMYTQQLKYLPLGDIDTLELTIANLPKLKDYALIVHDKDIENGIAVEPHVHAMMRFDEAQRINTIAKNLQDNPQQVVYWKGDSTNGFSYLIHATEHSRHKHQYDVSEVHASFDYPKMMLDVAQKIESKYRKASINNLLDAMLRGEINKTQLESMLTGSQYADNKRRIDTVYNKRLEVLAKSYKEYMKKNNISTTVVWIYGPAGTGKTKLAKAYAEKKGNPYFISGSTRDIFQNYEGQSTIILDELRSNSFGCYADLLRILDPYGEDKMAPARYYDKQLACDLIIITCPYSPHQFFSEMNINNTMIDTFNQLERRLSIIIHMADKTISMTRFNYLTREYEDILYSVRPNPYSAWNSQPSSVLNIYTLYDDIIS